MYAPFPILMVFAGPNGSGKSTITSQIPIVGKYVNADEIQYHLHCDSLSAAIVAEQTRERLLFDREDFTIETVLSTERNINLMRRAKDAGYHVTCIYVLTSDPRIMLPAYTFAQTTAVILFPKIKSSAAIIGA